jgi:hypothetical protein
MKANISGSEATRALRRLVPAGSAGTTGWAFVIAGTIVCFAGVAVLAIVPTNGWGALALMVGGAIAAVGWFRLIRLATGPLFDSFEAWPDKLERVAETFVAVAFGSMAGAILAGVAPMVARLDGWATVLAAIALMFLVVELQRAAIRLWAMSAGRSGLAIDWQLLVGQDLPADDWIGDVDSGGAFKYLRDEQDGQRSLLPVTVIERLAGPVPLYVVYRRGRSPRPPRVGSVLAQTVAGSEPDQATVLALKDCRVGERDLSVGELIDLTERIEGALERAPRPT